MEQCGRRTIADLGFLVTETGGGFTWAINSHENRLTPWSNDVVSDPPGEVIYLRDEDSGGDLDADAFADPRECSVLNSPRTGLHRFRARESRYLARAAHVCAAGCAGENFAAAPAQSH